MKISLILILLALTTNAFSLEPDPKIWCLVFFKGNPNKKFLLESELIGILNKKQSNDYELYTLKGRILENSKYKQIDTYVVKSTACTDDLAFAQENLKNTGRVQFSKSDESGEKKDAKETLITQEEKETEVETSKKENGFPNEEVKGRSAFVTQEEVASPTGESNGITEKETPKKKTVENPKLPEGVSSPFSLNIGL